MSGEIYEIGFNWANRQESSESCARRLTQMLKGLAAIHPVMTQWYTDAARRGESAVPRVPLPTGMDELREVFDNARRRKDNGTLWPELGYALMAWNGIDGPQCFGFTTWPGHYASTRSLPNSVGMKFSRRQSGNADLLTADVLRSVVLSAVSAWEPVCGVVSAKEYLRERYSPPQHWPNFRSGWMTYLSAPYARKVTAPPSAITETVTGGGILMLATEEPFSASNAEHVAVADAIQACLEPLQTDPLHERG